MSKPENIIVPWAYTPEHLWGSCIPQTGLLENITARNQPPTWNCLLTAANDTMINCANWQNESHYNIIVSIIQEAYLEWYGLGGRRPRERVRNSVSDYIKIIAPEQHFPKLPRREQQVVTVTGFVRACKAGTTRVIFLRKRKSFWVHVSQKKCFFITMAENNWQRATHQKIFFILGYEGGCIKKVPILLLHWTLKINWVKFNPHTDPPLITLEVNAYGSSFKPSRILMMNSSDDKIRLERQ